ncbi:MAG: hypothetical protein ACK5LL_00325 [Suipraeoptans sp.]
MRRELAKGDIQAISKRLGCTRQYASEVISAYRNGIVRRGAKAAKIIKAYKDKQLRFQEEQKECDKLQRTTPIA